MQTSSGTALFAVLLAVAAAASLRTTGVRSTPEAAGRAPAPALDLALAWQDATAPAPGANVWSVTFRIANRGAHESGALRLRARTPLGLASEETVATHLAAGATLVGSLEIALVPGLSELCLDVRAFDGEGPHFEIDTDNNRVCRRLDPLAAASRPIHAVPSQESSR